MGRAVDRDVGEVGQKGGGAIGGVLGGAISVLVAFDDRRRVCGGFLGKCVAVRAM